MGRLIILILIILAIVLLYRAFGPHTWRRRQVTPPPAIKGPDDDPDFLWKLERDRRRRERERKEREQRDQRRQEEEKPED